ncbi:MAG: M42 family peptidase [Oscillospiraceae bacterium]|jgi:endoglucanase|nr:M42 family peptidase [Oscillospiraceae bacterium]
MYEEQYQPPHSHWLEELCALPGVSGREGPVRDWIIAHLPAGAAYRVDPLGNLIVNGGQEKVMLCAHMDEVGLIVTHITDEGLLKFDHVGGIERAAYLGRQVFVGKNALPGVIGVVPVHLLRAEAKKQLPAQESLCIDIGADSREAAARLVKPGDTATFEPGFTRFGEGFVQSKALDDRVGCLILLELLWQNTGLCAVFSAREEVGGAAAAAAFALRPRCAVIIETTTASDLPGVSGAQRVCELGGGAVVPFMDRGTMYARELYERAMSLAKKAGIPAQTKSVIAGANDAHTIHTSAGGIPCIAISVPCRNLHSPGVVMRESDARAVFQLADLLWKELTAQ